jgi:dipeptidyl aminopeptidase/acylaminoacyl peptidase
MTQTKIANFGAWKSPITSDLIVADTIGLGTVLLDQNNIYWLEARPQEKGRNVIVKQDLSGKNQDIIPSSFNVRTRVHEYGGGAFLVENETIYFVNFADQRLYIQTPNSEPKALTEENKKRYADLILDSSRNRLICVCEDHSEPDQEPENQIIAIDLVTGKIEVLIQENDFYSSPRLSPDGKYLAWISWNHPNMPWDESQLWLGEFNQEGLINKLNLIAGDDQESICQPEWSPDGNLYFVSDATGWWNLYRHNLAENNSILLYQKEAEFGYPHWVFGESLYGFQNQDTLICSYSQNGQDYLARLDLKTQILTPIETPYTSISYLRVNQDQIVFIGGSPTQPTAIVTLDLNTEKSQIIKTSTDLSIDPGYLSIPQAIAFPTDNGLTAYGWYYPPKNKDFNAPEGELPPLLVKSHGGPTACAFATFSLRIQYWTSRGFAYLDVNYGGSTGYGREYRQRLNGNWGVVDVNDCINGAKYLVDQGLADPEKLAISGGSAGGYTTLAALTFHNVFKAGASYYGVSDLEALATDTHKFEARYLDRLIGKYPEDRAVYQERSPINFCDRLSCPVIFFQGLEDQVVPPNQAEMMVEVLKNKGLPVAYVPFEGEQHGFRQADNIKKALDGEFDFYSRIFGFKPAENIEPIEIITPTF